MTGKRAVVFWVRTNCCQQRIAVARLDGGRSQSRAYQHAQGPAMRPPRHIPL